VNVFAFCDYFRPTVGGGAERVAYEVYRRLADRGHEITVVTTSTSGDGNKTTSTRWADEHGLRIVEIPTIDLSRVLGLQVSLISGALEKLRPLVAARRPDLLHANSLEFQTSIAAARLRRASGIPMVLTAHIAGFASMAQPWRALGALHGESIGRFLLKRADSVIAVSEAVARHVRRLGAKTEVRVVPNGVDHGLFGPGTSRSADHVAVLFVGRLVPNKGAEEAIRAVAALQASGSRVQLTILGDGPLRAHLESLAVALGTKVRFLGWTPEVAPRLREADVLVRPTFTEGMSLTVLEAMASGVCVVASDVPGNAELIRHEQTGLLAASGDGPALVRALDQAVKDEEGRRRLGAAALDASKAYSWERCTEETLQVFLNTRRANSKARI
jgi:glycosyltransferase involved in cell wall biosynthesis